MTKQQARNPESADVHELARLSALERYAIMDTPAEPEFDEVARLAASLCETPIALISLLDETRQWFKSHIGLEVRETPREMAFCNHAIKGSVLLEVGDALKDPRFCDNPLVTGEPCIRFYAGVPLLTSDGYALGTLCVIDREQRRLNQQQRSALSILARQVMQQLELRRSLSITEQEIHRRREAERQLQQLNRTLEDKVRERSRVLQATLDRLHETEIQLHTMFENAAVGLAAIDSAARLQRCNQLFYEVVDSDPSDCLGLTMDALVSAEDAGRLSEGLMSALEAQQGRWIDELRLGNSSVEQRWVRFGIVPVRGGNDPNMRGIVVAQNVSPGKLAEFERDRFFELSAELFLIAGHDGLIHRINPACRKTFALAPGESLAARLVELVEPVDRDRAERALANLTRGTVSEAFTLDLRMRDAAGDPRIIRWSAVNWQQGQRLIIAGRDVTDIIQTQRELHALAMRLQSIREEERTRISREIHDDLGQRLTALKMDLNLLGQDLTAGRSETQLQNLRADWQSSVELVDTTMDAVRRIAQDLRPDVLDALGLGPAVEWLMQDLEKRFGLHSTLHAADNLPPLSDAQTTAVFRIIQESLTNVVRHAQASLVTVNMTVNDDILRVTISDDGRGIERDQNDDGRLSLGLLGMRERARSIGASLDFSSAAGQGVCVELALPLGSASESSA